MTEDILHEFFHAVLPTLTAYADYALGLGALAFGAWVRAKFQVRDTEIATLLVELEAQREEALGQKPDAAVKKIRAQKKARERMHPLIRPRASRQEKLIESVRPGKP